MQPNIIEAWNTAEARLKAQQVHDALESIGWRESYNAATDLYTLTNTAGGFLLADRASLLAMPTEVLRGLCAALEGAAHMSGPLRAEASRVGDGLPTFQIIRLGE